MFKNSKCYVTGGRNGFIGANIVKYLINCGAFVYASSKSPNKPASFIVDDSDDIHAPKLTLFTEDLSDFVTGLHQHNIDYVFHCAAHTAGAYEMTNNPVAQITENLFMNARLLDAAAKCKVKKFVFISSSAIYPDSEIALPESMGFTGDPPGNYFGVGWMKRYTEKLAEFYYRQYGMDILIIRPSNVYGPMCGFDLESAHVLPALIRKFVEKQNPLEVWGNPDVVRDFIYIDDFVSGVMKAFEKFSGFDVYNIASGQLYTIGQSVDIIKALTNYDGVINYNASKPTTIQERKVDISKALKQLNWVHRVAFRDGLRKTIDWYKNHINDEAQKRQEYNLYGR